MQAGDTIGRRFLLVRAEEDGLTGLVRYLAKDTRLDQDVTVDIITSRAPSAVIRAAQQARVLRDKRLSRVLAAGIERIGNERTFFVATERPLGVRLDELLGKIAFAPASAAAVIGEAAAALDAVVGTGTHHGLVRAEAITVTGEGRVMLSGLGVDGVVAAQSGRIKVTNERADAVALANLYLAAITAMDPTQATTADIPSDVPPAARELCHALIKGSGPTSLSDVTTALGTGEALVLRALVAEAPSLWWPWSPAAAPPELRGEADAIDGGEALGLQGPGAEPVGVHVDMDPADFPAADFDSADLGAELVEAELVDGELVTGDLVTAGAYDDDVIDGDIVDLAAARPRTRFGGAVDDLDEFHDIVAAQNVGTQQSVAEAILDRLHKRFPASAPLANAAAIAQRRAHAAAPLNAGPLLLALLLVSVFVAAIIGASLLTKPYVPDFDGHNNPPQTYPAYTFGSTPTPE